MSDHEEQGTGADEGAAGHELQGRDAVAEVATDAPAKGNYPDGLDLTGLPNTVEVVEDSGDATYPWRATVPVRSDEGGAVPLHILGASAQEAVDDLKQAIKGYSPV